MNLESSILNSIRLAASPATLWRNNSGAYMKDGFFVRYGVASPGGSDLIGFTPRNGIAVFTAIEVKTRTGKPTPEQQNFLNVIRRAGGIAGIARSPAEAQALIRGYR